MEITESEKALAREWATPSGLLPMLLHDVPVKLLYGHRDGALIKVTRGTDIVAAINASDWAMCQIIRALHWDEEVQEWRLPANRSGLFWRFVRVVEL